MKKPSVFVRLITWSFVIFLSFMGILVAKISFWEGFRVPTPSMTPTFRVGDVIWVDKRAYGLTLPWEKTRKNSLPRRGEVIVFIHPQTQEYYVKRLIGLPGDSVMILGRSVYVNGKRIETFHPDARIDAIMDESWQASGHAYIATTAFSPPYYVVFSKEVNAWRLSGTWTVPDRKLFVLGDFRDESSDSREWGYVPLENVLGRAVCQIDAGHIDSEMNIVPGRTHCGSGFVIDF